jgi:hypothetical protein
LFHYGSSSELLIALIENGANMHAVDSIGRNFFYYIQLGNVVTSVIDYATSNHMKLPSFIDNHERTPLHYTYELQLAIVWARIVNPAAKDYIGNTACMYSRRKKITKFICDCANDTNTNKCTSIINYNANANANANDDEYHKHLIIMYTPEQMINIPSITDNIPSRGALHVYLNYFGITERLDNNANHLITLMYNKNVLPLLFKYSFNCEIEINGINLIYELLFNHTINRETVKYLIKNTNRPFIGISCCSAFPNMSLEAVRDNNPNGYFTVWPYLQYRRKLDTLLYVRHLLITNKVADYVPTDILRYQIELLLDKLNKEKDYGLSSTKITRLG